ncbi:mobilization protein [Acinetobacter baumannii]|uniref:mobilization protein n=1 Tax=Acinetobacter baumannii TaxID=470 RepID=UPI003F4BDFA6
MTKAAETLEKKIEAQLEKLKQLKARKQAIEARERSKQKEQERKDDTRRKILLGSYLIKKMQSNEANKEKILAELNEYLTEDRDRQLFQPLKSVSVRKALNSTFCGFLSDRFWIS